MALKGERDRMPFARNFGDPYIFYKTCDSYFKKQIEEKGVISKLGLRIYLDISAQGWVALAKDEKFKDVCEWAEANIEHWLECKLLLDNKPVGAIFQLKSAHGRTDQPEKKADSTTYIYVFGDEAKRIKEHKADVIDVQDVTPPALPGPQAALPAPAEDPLLRDAVATYQADRVQEKLAALPLAVAQPAKRGRRAKATDPNGQ